MLAFDALRGERGMQIKVIMTINNVFQTVRSSRVKFIVPILLALSLLLVLALLSRPVAA